MSVVENLNAVREKLPVGVELVAVSKTKPEEDILEAYAAGQRHFGENKVQDLGLKYEHLPQDIHWHFIGHLQTNKVKYIAPFVYLIHAVDSVKLLKMIQKEALKNNRVISVLLQVKIAEEDSKFGLSFNDAECIFAERNTYPNVKIEGVMAMATNTQDLMQVRDEFRQVNHFFEKVKADTMHTLSLGMSNDWTIAVEEGSNMVRIGSSIFGARIYK